MDGYIFLLAASLRFLDELNEAIPVRRKYLSCSLGGKGVHFFLTYFSNLFGI